MALTLIQQVRLEIADNDLSLPILSDEEYEYFLEKNSNSVRRASLDAAKTILFKLSQVSSSKVDIFEIRGSDAAKAYIQALKLYIKSPDLNSMLTSAKGYVAGVSKEDMDANDLTLDNNIVSTPLSYTTFPTSYFDINVR